MKSHLKEHQNNLSRIMKSLSKDKDSMFNMIDASFTLVLLKCISKYLNVYLNLDQLKFRSIMNQMRTYTYSA